MKAGELHLGTASWSSADWVGEDNHFACYALALIELLKKLWEQEK